MFKDFDPYLIGLIIVGLILIGLSFVLFSLITSSVKALNEKFQEAEKKKSKEEDYNSRKAS